MNPRRSDTAAPMSVKRPGMDLIYLLSISYKLTAGIFGAGAETLFFLERMEICR
jgi:hypothetical protein